VGLFVRDPNVKARAQSDATHQDALACLRAAVVLLGVPQVLVDVGCGSGALVYASREQGLAHEAVGLDLGVETRVDTEKRLAYIHHDLTQPFKAGVRGDLTLCWEVGEHLPASAADVLCDTVSDVTGYALLFSAATPGQRGSGHINEQPHEYWRTRLEARGLRYAVELTVTMRQAFGQVAPRAWWYGKNMLVFYR
jgi:hypothetical protein